MTPRRFDLLVFDWDGTLADSLDSIVDTVQAAADSAGLPQRNRKQLLSIIGLGLDAGIASLYPDATEPVRAKLAESYRERYRDRAAEGIRLYPAAADTVRELHMQGFLMAVATGKSRRGLELAFQQSGLKDFFHASRCADETFSKPHPGMLQEIMTDLDIDPGRTLMIGDSQHDLQMATNAGVSALAVNYGAQTRERLLEFAPLDCLDSLRELPGWLAQTVPGGKNRRGNNDD